jgi:diguanylate cyclase (GGDEF)-like protein
MQNRKQRQQKETRQNAGRARAPKRQFQTPPQHVEAPQRPTRSYAMRLVAEVERLERELVAARAQMAALEACAEIDPLTNLVNRRGFERELNRACAYVKRYGTSAALIYVDLDDFKRINDQHGHIAGDAMLRAVGMMLSRHVRASDLAARVGGDEFALLLWHCSEADASAKALALEAAIAQTTATHAGAGLSVDASAGAALLLPGDHPADVVERADRAMYARKRARSAEAAE